MVGFEGQSPAHDDGPRKETPGEVQVRLASWIKLVLGFVGIKFYPFEEEALAKAMGPVIRRFPWLKTWKVKAP